MILVHVMTSSLGHGDPWAFVLVVAAIVGAAAFAFREYRRSKQWGEEQEVHPDGD